MQLGAMVMVAALTGAAALGQATQPAGRWEAVARGLSSEVFAEREAAQKALEKATWRDAEALRALALGATDAEVKARLAQQMERLELEMLVRPPPISLEVNHADLPALAGALSKATGVEWTTWALAPKGATWTLKAEERPLWEVFTQLEKQAGLHASDAQGKVQLAAASMQPGGPGPMEGMWTETVAGDYLFYVAMARPTMEIMTGPPRAPNARPPIRLTYGFRGDPRLRLVRCGIPEIEKVVDDQGTALFVRNAAQPHSFGAVEPVMPEVNTMISFPAPAGAGRKVTISGRMQVLEALERERVMVKEVTTQQSDPVMAGGRAWRIWAVDLSGGKWVVNVSMIGRGDVPYTYIPVSIRLEDAAGKVLWDGQADGNVSAKVTAGAMKLPLKATFLAATLKVGTRSIPFEFKDVPVPAPGRPGQMELPAELGLPEGNQ